MTTADELEIPAIALEDEASKPQVFYKIDGRRVTLGEYSHGLRASLVVPYVLVCRLFGAQITSSADDLTCHSLKPFEVPEAVFPPDARDRMEPLLRELARLGYVPIVFHDIDDAFHLTRTFLATLVNPQWPAIIARVHFRVWSVRQPPRVALFVEFISALEGGTFLWSLSSKPDWLSPPSVKVVRHPALAPAELLQVHEHRLAPGVHTNRALPARDHAEALAIAERHHAALRDFHLQRGVLVRRTETDHAQAMRVQRLTLEGNPHAGVIIELERRQAQRTSWSNAILILVVSLGLFIGAGAAVWSWKILWFLLAILAFHELGHYIAMRVFEYRNLRMFFIPMLGAAVSGQHYAAPAWKKVNVALAGPLPGILVGLVLGFAGRHFHSPLMLEAAILTLIINGMNLLPVLPLDGGRVVHTLLFSRHYVLDVGFRLVAASILLAAGYYTEVNVFFLLGILLLLSLPTSFRATKIASDLRREGIGQHPAADSFVPTALATAILNRLRPKLSKNISNKLLAQHTLAIYETIATRRAGWLATVGFTLLHGLALLVAGVSVGFFMAGSPLAQ